MGSLKSVEKSEFGGRTSGKIDASLSDKLKSVEWGEYKIGDLFYVQTYKKRFDANKVTVLDKGKHPYIVRMSSDNGQKGFIDADEEYLNEGNTLSFGQDTATVFYQEKPYFTGDKIKILKCKNERFGKNNSQFFVSAITKAFSSFSWGTSSYSIDVIENQLVKLPAKNNEPDFDFMESFIAELEAQRIAELEAQRIAELSAYLKVSGFDNYELSAQEQNALEELERLDFTEYDITDIFYVKNTFNILSSDIVKNSGNTPYLCASSENNGVSTYIKYYEHFKEKGNCIFIGGKTFVVSYQEKDFYSNDSHNLALYLKAGYRTKLNQLYLATCVNKSLGHKYSWGDSVSKAKISNDKILLPTKDGKPYYEFMGTFISAVQKLVIRDVVLYAEQKIDLTKSVIGKE